MTDSKKKLLKIFSIVFFVLASVFIISYSINKIKEIMNRPTTIIVDNKKELETIDSLTTVINIQDKLIQQLKDS